MKTRPTVERRASSVESRSNTGPRLFRPRLSSLVPRRAFTLIELLTVIAIIAVIAALILPVGKAVKIHSFENTAQAEMSQLETAIDRYHAAYGFYPPCNANNVLVNQLYYELVGTTMTNNEYVTLDGSTTIAATDVNKAFGVGVNGFMNCNKPGADESAPHAQDFLPDLKPAQIARNYTNNTVAVTLLVTSDGGPDPTYQPLGVLDWNPWRYNSSSPTNNPGSYDLWVQLQISGKKYLICNWNNQVQINNPLP